MDTTTTLSLLVPPYGGSLVELVAADAEREPLLRKANTLPSLQLSQRALCDLELLATGAFSPVDRFMGRADYIRVVEEMRLADGTLFPIPITLPVSDRSGLRLDDEVALRSPRNELVAIMRVEEAFPWNPVIESKLVYGTTDTRHPVVAEMASWGRVYISGPLTVLSLPEHHDFPGLRRPPVEVRAILDRLGNANVVAFQTENPIYRGYEELIKRAAAEIGGTLLIHPVVGLTKPADIDHYTRVRTYKLLVEKYFTDRPTLLSLLHLATRLAGPREAVWHAIIRRNHGVNHFIVGRDHASPGKDSMGRLFYEPRAAQELLAEMGQEVGVKMIPSNELVYLPETDRYEEVDRVPGRARYLSITGTQVRDKYLAKGKPLPTWFARPEVGALLAKAYPPRHEQGFCVWFTGLPSAGKSTIAEVLAAMLVEQGRQLTVLDGDVVRTHLSKGLGFSREDRDTNILRIGFVAAEIVRHHGSVLCAAVSPYEGTRNRVCSMVGGDHFILVFVNTPVEVCEQRDPKGLYAKARRGEITGFTGVDDPYEAPPAPDIIVTPDDGTPQQNALRILNYLMGKGFLLEDSGRRNYETP